MFGKGWTSIIIGIILLVLLVFMYQESRTSNDKAKDIIENGWYYKGTTIITEEQFNTIKQAEGDVLTVIELNPLTVEYGFGSVSTYDYLQREDYSGWEKSGVGMWEILIIVIFFIPIFAIISGIGDLMGNKKGQATNNNSSAGVPQ